MADPALPDDIRAQIEAARRRVLALDATPPNVRTRAAEAAARAASSAEAAVAAWIWNGEESAP